MRVESGAPVGAEGPIGIIVAVQEELRAILKRMSPAVVDSADGFQLHWGQLAHRPVAVAKSGMGAERARNAAEHLIRCAKPKALIIAGFCGGITIDAGQLILPETVVGYMLDGARQELKPDGDLLDRGRALAGPTINRSVDILLTADAILTTRAEKRLAARGSNAVDMETLGAAIAAAEFRVPWIAVRAASDGPLDDLPLDFSLLTDPNGEIQRGRVAMATLSKPWKIPALVQLGLRSSRAARNLAEFVERYVAEL